MSRYGECFRQGMEKALYRQAGSGPAVWSGEPSYHPPVVPKIASPAAPTVHLTGLATHIGNAFKTGMGRIASAVRSAGSSMGQSSAPSGSLEPHMPVIKPVHAIASAGNARHWTSTVSRATKNDIGGAATHSFQHFYTHGLPMKKAESLQFAYEKAGHHVGEIARSKVRLADGSTRHMYSFNVTHKDGGATHTINMFRGRNLNPEE